MNYYFFPCIAGFDSSITLVNFPCLETQKALEGPQHIYATWTDGERWHYYKLRDIEYKKAIEIKHSELPKQIPESPFLFFHPDILPKTSEDLFVSDHMYFMPTWRGNIKIFSNDTATSYEGDYQHEMVCNIRKGSLVSISPMVQDNPNVNNVFILVNITKSPLKIEHAIYFFDPLKKEIIYKEKVYTNTCNVINLKGLKLSQGAPLLTISQTISGIPLYFSYTDDKKSLSFEHTHPPASFIVFGDSLYFQAKLKKYWLQALEKELAHA